MENREIRSFGGVATPTIQGRTISGYAIVFNSKSEVMYDFGSRRRFREIISPQAVNDALIQRSDIKMLLEHDSKRLLARCKQGRGTLKWSIDHNGVLYSFTSPNTSDGDFAVEMLRLGNLTGSSFAFYVSKDSDSWRKDGDIWVRTINKIERLTDFSIVSDPAYSETSADVRSKNNGNTDYKKNLQKVAKSANIPFTTKEKLEALRKEIDKFNLL